jgi:predicted TIM-barrel enzyme
MLSDEQKRVALKKNMEAMIKEAKKLRAGGVEGITLTYYADEESFQKMRLDVETEDFAFRQMMTVETAKLMIKHGLDIEVQVLDADNYFSWLGNRENTYEAQHEYPGGQHLSGADALALLGIK